MRLAETAAPVRLMASLIVLRSVEARIRMDGKVSVAGKHAEKSLNGTAALVDELLELTSGLLSDDIRSPLIAGQERLQTGQFNLVVLGEFKRGKSSLVNALLGRDVVPTGVLPLTNVVTAIRAGEADRLVVGFREGGLRERPFVELPSFATEEGNPGNLLGVTSIEIEIGSDFLDEKLRLIDTPGIESIHDHNNEATFGFAPQTDAALIVLAADQPLTAAERELIGRVGEIAPRLIFALNRIDLLGGEDVEAARAFLVRHLNQEVQGEAEVFCVSARSREGIGPLAEHLRHLSRGDGRDLTRASVRMNAASLAAEATAVAALERSALEIPLRELDSRRRLFESRVDDLSAARADAADLLERRVERILEREVNQPLREIPREIGPTLANELAERSKRARRISPRQLAEELEKWTDQRMRSTFGELEHRFEEVLSERIAELEQVHAKRIEGLLKELDEAAGEAFGVPTSLSRLQQVGLREPPHFTFKLSDPQHMLEALLSGARRLAPGPVGRRLVLSNARTRLGAMVDRHAGRLRSELVEVGRATVADYRRDLEETVEKAVAEIRAAADRAHGEHTRGEQSVRGRIQDLESLESRFEEMKTELHS